MALTLRGSGQVSADNYGIDSDGSITATGKSFIKNNNSYATSSQTSYDNASLRLDNLTGGSSIGTSFGVITPNANYIQSGYNEGTTAPLTLNPYGGNVGINESNPSHRLHINGGSNDEARVRVTNTANGQASLDLDNGEGYFRTYTDAGEYRIYDQTDGAHRLVIDTSGYVTTPYQPSFIARTNSTFNYTGGTGYATITNFGNVILNRSNSYNSSTGTFTAPVTGHYQFTFQLLLSNVASGDDSIHIAFYQNQSHQLNANIRSPGSAANSVVGYGQYLPVIGVGDMYMSANDTLQIKLSSSGTMNVYAGGDWGRFSGHLIG